MRLIDADKLHYIRKLFEDSDKSEVVVFAKEIDKAPTVDAVPVIRCKNCKHFELNHWENVNGIPLIAARGICTKWGDGCKTSMDGYCFLAERGRR